MILFLTGCQSEPLTKTDLALDTVVTITLYEGGDQEILDKAFEIIKTYDKNLNANDSESALNKIGTSPTPVDSDLFELLKENVKYSKMTGSLFRPTLGRLIKLWNIGEPTVKEAPNKESIDEALNGSETENLILDETTKTASLSNELTKLNLGASSKGFIADKLKSFLTENGVKSAIINLGGNVVTVGKHSGGEFNIGVENPEKSGESIGVISAHDVSVVTSGNYQRYFTDSSGKRYHHILDPRTGYPAETGLDEVVVVSNSSLEGDILSTALFIMGREQGIEFLKNNHLDDVGVIFVGSDKKIYLSQSLESKFTLEPNYRDSFELNFF